MEYSITIFLCLLLAVLIVFFTTVIFLVMRSNRYQERVLKEREENMFQNEKQRNLGKKEFTFHNGKIRLYARNYFEAHTEYERYRSRGGFKNSGDPDSLSA